MASEAETTTFQHWPDCTPLWRLYNAPSGSVNTNCSVLSGAGLAVGEAGQATALVVDAQVTSYLMMGALSPGLKRHSVTLFEGERLTNVMCITSSRLSHCLEA